jgi:hypothetical protein
MLDVTVREAPELRLPEGSGELLAESSSSSAC